MICFHKFGKVEKDGYQYCAKCGKATMPKHEHRWTNIERVEVKSAFSGDVPEAVIHVQKCSICGEMSKFKV